MCADIMAIAIELSYRDQLRCGSPRVEHRMLSLIGDILFEFYWCMIEESGPKFAGLYRQW